MTQFELPRSVLLLVLCLLPFSGNAETPPARQANGDLDATAMSLDDLGAIKVPTVYAASKREQSQSEAPSSVTIVTARDINKEYGYRTLAEVVNSVRGLYATYDRAYTFLGVRGVNRLVDYGGRNLLNINGHRINEPIFDSSFLRAEFLLDLDLIERVEVNLAHAVDNSTGLRLNNSPRHVGKVQFTGPLDTEKRFAGFEFIARSRRGTSEGNHFPALGIANLNFFSRDVVKDAGVSAGIYNLFDRQYHDPASPAFAQDLNPRDGRTFRLKMT